MVLEVRRDSLKGVDVIVADERSRRPRKKRAGCPFCRGNEDVTPKTISAYPNEKNWRVRRFNNAFPILRPGRGHFAWCKGHAPAIGRHEVIVDTEKHSQSFQDYSREHLALVWRAYRDAYADLNADREAKVTFLMRNRGAPAGASIAHEHAQIVSLPFIPVYLRNEAKKAKKGGCYFCSITKKEEKLFETKNFVCVLPYNARWECESWVVPKKHYKSLPDLTDEEGLEFLEAIQEALKRTDQFTQNYNVAFHCAPKGSDFHLHAEIYPRKETWAAIELGLGVIVNVVSEKKAKKLLSRP